MQSIPRSILSQFSTFSSAFGNQQNFIPFLQSPFNKTEDLVQQIRLKKETYPSDTRKVLCEVLSEQLGSNISEKQKINLSLLSSENTFTITTGHQLSLFAGPLYFVYKILHAVKLSEEFELLGTSEKCVPIFWLASEDHDFEEVQETPLFGKTYTWETQQQGAVGRFRLDDFEELKNEFKSLFEGKNSDFHALFEIATDLNYGEWMQQFVSKLFQDFGVLVLNPDDHRLKTLFSPIMEKELNDKTAFRAVEKTNALLTDAHWSPQAQVREINLFYLGEGKRKRIEFDGNDFSINHKLFSKSELVNLLKNKPEDFSPNVILRPVYQETILPNLCYIGGGGEMAYWIQLKGVFEEMKVTFPLLLQRASLQLLDQTSLKKIEKLPFKFEKYFESLEDLQSTYLQEYTEDELNLNPAFQKLNELKEELIRIAAPIDSNLKGTIEAEIARIEKSLENLAQKMRKQLRQKHEQQLNAISFVSERMLPKNTLQERYYHFMQFAPDGNFKNLFDKIYERIEIFENVLQILHV